MAIGLAFALSATRSTAAGRWNAHSIRVVKGYVANAATVDARDAYQPLHMGARDETGLGFTMTFHSFDCELMLTQLQAGGTQHNEAGGRNQDNSMAIDMDITKMAVTARRNRWLLDNRVIAWYGGGVHLGLVETLEQQRVQTNSGYMTQVKWKRTSSVAGIQASLGLDIYPVKYSSLAIAAEGRYDLSTINGPFHGKVGGFAFVVGIRWDFWPDTR